MRIPLLRTLSGRIVVGFTILTFTFGTISALIVFNMVLLGRQIRLIRTGYLPLALETKNLDEKQHVLWSYISDELVGESVPARAQRRIVQHTRTRARSLRDTEKVLAELSGVPAAHARRIAETRALVAEVRTDIAALTEHYRVVQAAPPLEVLADVSSRSAEEAEAQLESRRALDHLITYEANILARIRYLSRQQSDQAKQIALRAEHDEYKLRMFAIYLGVTSVLIGLLITIWATMTLRPLQRLRDGARRIAAGEYKSRIDAKGPAEVADLAREFNVMAVAIEERERQLVRSERLIAVGKMSAVITHEVRNPLSSIGLNTELLTELVDDLAAEVSGSAPGREVASRAADSVEEARSLCASITNEVDRLTAITEEYLQFARLPKPKLQLDKLSRIVHSLAEFEREQLLKRGVELQLDVAARLPSVQVDEAQMRQALLNLIRNAAEAVEEDGGEVTIRIRQVRREGSARVELSVSDTGPGIPEEARAKLFEPFFSTKQGGTGLGLALTHQIIHEHGGELRVESAAGEGATFIIDLPAAA